MKKAISYLKVLITASIVLGLASCAKDGETGPAGATGPQGNANVIVYVFDTVSFTGGHTFILDTLPSSIMENALVLMYYRPSGNPGFYPCPGLGESGDYITRYFLFQTSPSSSIYDFPVTLYAQDGITVYTNPVVWAKTKIVIAPASVVRNGRRAHIDFSDYETAKKYFNLKD